MFSIVARNVHQALPEMLHQLQVSGVRQDSRNGPVLVFPEPVCVEYRQPCERVLFWPERDANPFFHFFEALWMLGGRRDVEFPSRFNSTFGQFSDDGTTFNGAYGWRWRQHFDIDQLVIIAKQLRENPNDRRSVLGMWDSSHDLGSSSKDVPCNLNVVFGRTQSGNGALDMTVFNRSNDIVWGALGANAVHFSVLQEIMASLIGCPVGRYWQISTNMHGYLNTAEPLIEKLVSKAYPSNQAKLSDPYNAGACRPFPLVCAAGSDLFFRDLTMFLSEDVDAIGYRTALFRKVAVPLYKAWVVFKDHSNPHRHKDALKCLLDCRAEDWKLACSEWVRRRLDKKERTT